jgi:predicted nucleic acid-binding protein
MGVEFFLDINVLVHAFNQGEVEKQRIARDLLRRALAGSAGAVSWQVIQEFLNVALRKFRVPLIPADCRELLATVLEPLCEVYPSVALYGRALDLHERTRFPFYDCLVVAGALAAGCGVLYSEDLQHDRVLDGLRIVNPFV